MRHIHFLGPNLLILPLPLHILPSHPRQRGNSIRLVNQRIQLTHKDAFITAQPAQADLDLAAGGQWERIEPFLRR